MSLKVIVTNVGAMKVKYGAAGWKKINSAVTRMVKADKARGLTTKLIDLSSKAAMKKVRGAAVSDTTDCAGFKTAVDAVATATSPDYIMLLGAIDVIPHQDMVNPLFSNDPNGDNDAFAYGDLPYACPRPYSRSIGDFVGPTRVVGRLPDITGGTDPEYLVKLIDAAATYTTRPAADYAAFLGVTALPWRNSTALSLQMAFGNNAGMAISPPSGPNWSTAELGRRSHFFNCHGAENDPRYFGQQGNNFPVAHDASLLAGKISAGTVAAAECCYGAQLSDPRNTVMQTGMVNTYLSEGAYGFWGSSTIAYGPASGNGDADIICQVFMQRVLAGASLGRAALEARQNFANTQSPLDPSELKTLGQFSLMGDPSVHPASPSVAPAGSSLPLTPKGAGMRLGSAIKGLFESEALRSVRRAKLVERGARLDATVATAQRTPKSKLSAAVSTQLSSLAKAFGLSKPEVLSFDVKEKAAMTGGKKDPYAKELSMHPAADRYHALVSKQDGAVAEADKRLPRIKVLLASEVDGRITATREVFSR